MLIDKIVQLSNKAVVCVPHLLKAGGRGAILFYILNCQAYMGSSSIIL